MKTTKNYLYFVGYKYERVYFFTETTQLNRYGIIKTKDSIFSKNMFLDSISVYKRNYNNDFIKIYDFQNNNRKFDKV